MENIGKNQIWGLTGSKGPPTIQKMGKAESPVVILSQRTNKSKLSLPENPGLVEIT